MLVLPLCRKVTKVKLFASTATTLESLDYGPSSSLKKSVERKLLCRSAAPQDGSGSQTTATFEMEYTKLSSVCYCLPLLHYPTLTLGSSQISSVSRWNC